MKSVFLNRSFASRLQRFAAFLLLFLLLGCEKDDICVDGDTPHLIIRFYDKDNPDITKSVSNLRITGDGLTSPLNTVNRITTDSIAIPLRAFESTSVFSFISNSGDNEMGMEIGNTDSISFDYQTREIFISRACGYVTNYDNLSAMIAIDGDNWMDSAEIINTTVANEAAAHIRIYH